MPYYLQADKVNLEALKNKIKSTDLVPSRTLLLNDIDYNFTTLKAQGVKTLADLRGKLKNKQKLPDLVASTKISTEYLTLLRREIESYFPKPDPTTSFDWLDAKSLTKLIQNGLKNSRSLYEALDTRPKREAVATELELEIDFLEKIFELVNLTKIQWINSTAARMLVDAGYKTIQTVAEADPDKLCDDLGQINAQNHYYKDKIGLRDTKRLIKAASYAI